MHEQITPSTKEYIVPRNQMRSDVVEECASTKAHHAPYNILPILNSLVFSFKGMLSKEEVSV
jgi:hypothetical protein